MTLVNFVQLVEQFPAGCSNGIGQTHKFFLVPNVEFEVGYEFPRHVKRYFGHKKWSTIARINIRLIFSEEYEWSPPSGLAAEWEANVQRIPQPE